MEESSALLAATVTLQACDGARVEVDALSLHESSTVFASMLDTVGDPSSETSDVLLTEDAATCRFLADFVDPARQQNSKHSDVINADTLYSVLLAADKYDIPSIVPFVKLYAIGHWDAVSQQPLSLCRLTLHALWSDLWESAKQATLEVDVRSSEARSYISQFFRKEVEVELVKYREDRCRQMMDVVWAGLSIFITHEDFSFHCLCGEMLDKPQFTAYGCVLDAVESYIYAQPAAHALWSPVYWSREGASLADLKCTSCSCALFDADAVALEINEC